MWYVLLVWAIASGTVGKLSAPQLGIIRRSTFIFYECKSEILLRAHTNSIQALYHLFSLQGGKHICQLMSHHWVSVLLKHQRCLSLHCRGLRLLTNAQPHFSVPKSNKAPSPYGQEKHLNSAGGCATLAGTLLYFFVHNFRNKMRKKSCAKNGTVEAG